MRTVRCSSRLLGRGLPCTQGCLPGGICLGGVCVYPGGCLAGGYLPGRCLPGGGGGVAVAGSIPTGGQLFAQIYLRFTTKQYKNDNIVNFV